MPSPYRDQIELPVNPQSHLRAKTVSPAGAPKPGRPGPGRPPGSKNRHPATRHDVGKHQKIGIVKG